MNRKIVFLSDLNAAINKIPCQSNRHSANKMMDEIPIHDFDELIEPQLCNKIVGVRWFSHANPWMDCVCLVKEIYKDKIKQAMLKGVDDYWDSDSYCYGNCIENSINRLKIPFVMLYYNEDERSDDEWEEYLTQFTTIGIEMCSVYDS